MIKTQITDNNPGTGERIYYNRYVTNVKLYNEKGEVLLEIDSNGNINIQDGKENGNKN